MNNSGYVLKRIVAYLIDILIVSVISAGLTYITFINPKYDEYMEVSEKYTSIMNDYYDKEIDAEELTNATKDLSYDISKTGYVYVIGDIVIAFLYFGVFAYFTKGQTLGKKVMGLRIVSNKDKELKIYQYFIRTFILNSVILNIFTLIAICFSKETYNSIYTFAANFDTILMLVIFLMIMFYKESRGLHDILAGTKVIDLKAVPSKEVESEPEVIKPKKKEKKDE